jgi:ATP-dependent DNA helicase RecG
MTPSEYPKLVPWIHDKLVKGQKLFVVAPLIEESEKMDNLHDVMSVYHDICELFAPYGTEYARIGLIHGRMKSSEKDQIMNDFSTGEITILVSTTVIEV